MDEVSFQTTYYTFRNVKANQVLFHAYLIQCMDCYIMLAPFNDALTLGKQRLESTGLLNFYFMIDSTRQDIEASFSTTLYSI